MKILTIVSAAFLITGGLVTGGRLWWVYMDGNINGAIAKREVPEIEIGIINSVVETVLDTSNSNLPITEKFGAHKEHETAHKIARLKKNGEPYTDYDFQKYDAEAKREYEKSQLIGQLINYGQVDEKIYQSHSNLSYNAANVEAHLALWHPVTSKDDIGRLAKTVEYQYRIKLAKESQELFAALALYEAGAAGELLSPEEANSFLESAAIDNYLQHVKSYLTN